MWFCSNDRQPLINNTKYVTGIPNCILLSFLFTYSYELPIPSPISLSKSWTFLAQFGLVYPLFFIIYIASHSESERDIIFSRAFCDANNPTQAESFPLAASLEPLAKLHFTWSWSGAGGTQVFLTFQMLTRTLTGRARLLSEFSHSISRKMSREDPDDGANCFQGFSSKNNITLLSEVITLPTDGWYYGCTPIFDLISTRNGSLGLQRVSIYINHNFFSAVLFVVW